MSTQSQSSETRATDLFRGRRSLHRSRISLIILAGHAYGRLTHGVSDLGRHYVWIWRHRNQRGIVINLQSEDLNGGQFNVAYQGDRGLSQWQCARVDRDPLPRKKKKVNQTLLPMSHIVLSEFPQSCHATTF